MSEEERETEGEKDFGEESDEGWSIPKEWIDEEGDGASSVVADVDEVWGVGEYETLKVVEEIKRKREAREEAEKGLRKCMVCGGDAKIRRCGKGKNAVFVGCWRGRECARRSVYREDGDAAKAAEEWNMKNGGTGLARWIERFLYWVDRQMGSSEWRKEARKIR